MMDHLLSKLSEQQVKIDRLETCLQELINTRDWNRMAELEQENAELEERVAKLETSCETSWETNRELHGVIEQLAVRVMDLEVTRTSATGVGGSTGVATEEATIPHPWNHEPCYPK